MDHERIAAIADIHGNTWALDAVLADIRRRGVATIVNLGDCVYGSLDPAGTIERLMASGIPTVSGNQDRDVFAPSAQERGSRDHQYITSRLTAAQIRWLADLPATLALGDLLCCHGTPRSDETYLLEQVGPQGVALKSAALIEQQLVGVTQPVVLCGHSHVPRTVWLPGDRLVVNPGSVGIPAYDNDQPYPYVMEAGSPHARYAILSRSAAGWYVEQIAVPYDWHAAAAVARQNGREDRARWIETGRAAL